MITMISLLLYIKTNSFLKSLPFKIYFSVAGNFLFVIILILPAINTNNSSVRSRAVYITVFVVLYLVFNSFFFQILIFLILH